IVGNIYKGRVVRVLPGMQAAFVDIGLDKAAFLYVADIVCDPSFPGFSEEIEFQAGAAEGDPLEIVEDVPQPLEDAVLAGAQGDIPSTEKGAAADASSVPAAASEPAEGRPAIDEGAAPSEAADRAVSPISEPNPSAESRGVATAAANRDTPHAPAEAAAGVQTEEVVDLPAEALQEDE